MNDIDYMLTDGKISLVILEEKHLEFLRKQRNNFEKTSRFLTSAIPINQKAQIQWFENLCKDSTKMYFAIEVDGTMIGIVRCDEWDKINQSIRVGVDIFPEFRKKEVAQKAYNLILPFLFYHLNINRIWLLVLEYNAPAISLYRKLRFKEEGRQRQAIFRDNKWNDYIMMSLLRKGYKDR